VLKAWFIVRLGLATDSAGIAIHRPSFAVFELTDKPVWDGVFTAAQTI
jgi:hypothetical protein